MQTASTDALVIERSPASQQPGGTITFSVLTSPMTSKSSAVPKGITVNAGGQAKPPCVLPIVFNAHDSILDWVGLDKKLASFRSLKKGWDGYKATPPDLKPVHLVSGFLDLLRQNRYLPSRLAPSVVGGVGVSFRKGGLKVYVEFSNKGTVHALFSDGVSEPVVKQVMPDSAGYRALVATTRAYLDE